MDSKDSPRTDRSKWIWTALLVSAGLNLFIGGWWAGSVVRPMMGGLWPGHGFGAPSPGPPPGENGRPPRRSPFRMLTQHLDGKISADGMREVTVLAGLIEESFEQRIEASQDRRARAREILAAERFDSQAFTKALTDLQNQRSVQDTDLVRRIAESMARLSLADRKVLAEVMVPLPPP